MRETGHEIGGEPPGSVAPGLGRFAGAWQRVFLVALLALWPAVARGQGDAARPSPEEEKRLRPGLLARFRQNDAGGERNDARQVRLPTLYVAAGTAPTALLSPGAFHATFEGYLRTKLKGDYGFRFEGQGSVRLKVNGEKIIEGGPGDLAKVEPATVLLGKGYNYVVIEYDSPPEGDATLRTYWSSDSFAPEPVPPTLLMHDSGDQHLVEYGAIHTGRELFAVYGCGRCHAPGPGITLGESAMPEMTGQAPSLALVGRRLSTDWIAAWTLNPQAMRNNVTMPQVLHGQNDTEERQQAADIAAYLGALGEKPSDKAPEIDQESIEIGEVVYEELGCISCHTTDPPEKDEYDRTTLHRVAAKFHPGSLATFLAEPRRHYAWSRMPDLQLDEEEVELLVAFLRDRAKGTVAPAPQGDPQRGKQLFESTGCANCHTVDDSQQAKSPHLATVLGGDRATGCLAVGAEQRGKAPSFPFAEGQRQALLAFIATDGASLAHRVDSEVSRRYVKRLNCIACHRRDTETSPGPEILAEYGVQGLPPEIIPPLTWAGEKLKPEWTERFLGGVLPYQSRPWMKARMPAFPTRAKHLAVGLSAEHGYSTNKLKEPEFDADLAAIGGKIALKNTGLDCHQCHGTGGKAAEAAYDTRGVNFAYVSSRLRYDFYRRWTLDPLRFDPATKMPKFAPDGKTTPVTHTYNGDAQKQFAALWHYLVSLASDEVPEDVGAAEGFGPLDE